MTLWQMYLLFAKIGLFTFGGGYAMIPLFQTELVTNWQFMTNAEFANFVALAQAYGWQAKRVQTQEELQMALSEMLSSTKPFLLDVVVPSSENVMPMVVPGGTLLEHVCPGNDAGNTAQEGE